MLWHCPQHGLDAKEKENSGSFMESQMEKGDCFLKGGHSLRWGGGGQVCSAPSPGLLEAIWKVLGLLLITWKTKQSRHLAVWETDERRDFLVARFFCVCVWIMLVINPVSLFLFTSDGPHPRFRRHVRQMSERGRKG